MATDDERFWRKVQGPDPLGCWTWAGSLNRAGYGQFTLRGPRNVMAHRYAYEALIGPIPDGLTIDHLCRNKACLNPWHLEPVPNGVNIRRGGNAVKTHCPRGHEYRAENTYLYRGSRYCRTCQNDQRRERRARARAG